MQDAGSQAAGYYIFNHAAYRLLQDFMKTVGIDKGMELKDNSVSNRELIEVNRCLRSTGIETIGATLRGYMSAMKPIS